MKEKANHEKFYSRNVNLSVCIAGGPSGSLALPSKDMTWNKEHINEVRYPDHPDLEQALGNFRQQFSWYGQQLKYRKVSGIDTSPVETAWASFLRLRKKYLSY